MELFAPYIPASGVVHLDASLGAAEEAQWSAGRSWVELLYSGTFHHYVAREAKGRSARSVTFTDDDLLGMPGVFRAAQAEGYWPGGGPKVDVNHALAFGSSDIEETRARARIVELRTTRRTDGRLALEGLFEWTASGVDLVASGAFAGISSELVHPDFALSKTTEKPLGGWLVEGATFCNDPMINGLREPELPKRGSALRSGRTLVLLSAASRGESLHATDEDDQMSTTFLLTAASLALSADATDAETSRAVEALKASRDDLAEKLSTRETALSEVKSDRDVIAAQRDELLSAQRTALVDRFVTEGRIVPAKSAALLRILDGETKVSGWAAAVDFVEGLWEKDKTVELGSPKGNQGSDDDQITLAMVVGEIEVEVSRLAKAEDVKRPTIELRTRAEDTVLARPGRMDAYLAADNNPHAPQA